MAEENKKQTIRTEEEKKLAEQSKPEIKAEASEKKKEDKKKAEEGKPRKTEAVVNGKDLGISTKHAIAICNFIRGKNIDKAVSQLQEVADVKRAIPMKGELPHRKGKGMERGRYPSNAAKQFIKLLRQLSANATINGLDLEKTGIECKANRASRPYRRGGSQRFKRTHVTLKLIIKQNKTKKK